MLIIFDEIDVVLGFKRFSKFLITLNSSVVILFP